MGTTDREQPTGKRRPGNRAGLDLKQVLEAARSLDADTLTVQAVANQLGVDRKAVRHHVTDRETLLRLMAVDAFSETTAGAEIPPECSWQEACRIFALAFTENVITIDSLAEHLRLENSLLTQFGEPTEAVVTKLIAAGFDDETALRSLALLTNICMAFARDTVVVSRRGERPRRDMAQTTLDGREEKLPNFARIVARAVDTYDREQLEMSIEVFTRGLESILHERHGRATG